MRESADRRARALCTHHLGEERPAVSVGELSSPVSRAPIGRLILHGIICPWHSSRGNVVRQRGDPSSHSTGRLLGAGVVGAGSQF